MWFVGFVQSIPLEIYAKKQFQRKKHTTKSKCYFHIAEKLIVEYDTSIWIPFSPKKVAFMEGFEHLIVWLTYRFKL